MITILASLGLLAWLYLDLFHGKFWRPLVPGKAVAPAQWPSIDIIVPARNEADMLPRSLSSLLAQDYLGAWRILLIDDHSTDGTGAIAHKLAAAKPNRLVVIDAPELPPDWNGKLAALNAGVTQSTADYVLFTDADIEHPSDSLRNLVATATAYKLDLVSLMVKLHCESFAEKLLIPAFVFFFALLYPFRRANDPKSRVAAAAGGVILVKRTALDKIGGLTQIRAALIDDCALAKAIKQSGGTIELTLTQDVKSLRPYPTIGPIWRMVARTAYAQLRNSPLLLMGTVLGMGILFAAPFLLPLATSRQDVIIAGVVWALMAMLYLPTILFYRLSVLWALTLPVAALIYIGATIDSARLYWQGKGGQWKGRTQAK